MPITKDAFVRYRILDKCFRNKIRRYQIDDLVNACNDELYDFGKKVSRRTIYYDIDYMKSCDGWEAPIEVEKDGNRRYYHYTDTSFSIDKSPATEAQLKLIQSAIDVLNNFKGLPHFEGLGDVVAKVGMMAYDTKASPCFGFDYNEDLVGKEYLTVLFNAIQYETVLKITYKPFNAESVEYIFHPQFIKQYNNRWYIFGMDDDNPDKIWNLAIDRIKAIESTKCKYIKSAKDWNDYFNEIIGVTDTDRPVEEIHFLVHGVTGHYIETKPLHETQHNRWIDNNTLDVRLKVKINYELEHLLLSYSDSITILSPATLVETHKQMLQSALSRYIPQVL